MSWPHEGVGGCAPSPRNESAAPSRMPKVMRSPPSTMIAGQALGRISRKTTYRSFSRLARQTSTPSRRVTQRSEAASGALLPPPSAIRHLEWAEVTQS